jgi:hypothetical protein
MLIQGVMQLQQQQQQGMESVTHRSVKYWPPHRTQNQNNVARSNTPAFWSSLYQLTTQVPWVLLLLLSLFASTPLQQQQAAPPEAAAAAGVSKAEERMLAAKVAAASLADNGTASAPVQPTDSKEVVASSSSNGGGGGDTSSTGQVPAAGSSSSVAGSGAAVKSITANSNNAVDPCDSTSGGASMPAMFLEYSSLFELLPADRRLHYLPCHAHAYFRSLPLCASHILRSLLAATTRFFIAPCNRLLSIVCCAYCCFAGEARVVAFLQRGGFEGAFRRLQGSRPQGNPGRRCCVHTIISSSGLHQVCP